MIYNEKEGINNIEKLEINVKNASPTKKKSVMKTVPMQKVFRYLTLFELIRCSQVSKRWNAQVNLALKKMQSLNFSQFWNIIGHKDINPILKLCDKIESPKHISFAYCEKINEKDFIKILKHINLKEKLIGIDLFYCLLLTDKAISQITRYTPKIKILNIGHLHNLSNKSVTMLSNMSELHTLIIKNNKNITDDVMPSLESGFSKLTSLDLQNTSLDIEAIEQLKESRPDIEILGPKNCNKFFNTEKIIKVDLIKEVK